MGTTSENQVTQPLIEQPVFNNPRILTESWYPAMASSKLKKGAARSFKLLDQRLVLYRGMDGNVRALDAFCPHMGADLSNGKVEGDQIRCYFHQWRFNENGELTDIPCRKESPKGVRTNAYPVQEIFGYIWIFAGIKATHFLTHPPGLEQSEIKSWRVRRGSLLAHHHVLFANGLDTQHFKAVHGIPIEFDFEVNETQDHCTDWTLTGKIPETGWRALLARKLLGSHFTYQVRIMGGSAVSITYGANPSARAKIRLPRFHITWGCIPKTSGTSDVEIFLIAPKSKGLFGPVAEAARFLLTIVILTILKDDDIKAFPNMRFNPGTLIEADGCVARLIQTINRLPVSFWTPTKKQVLNPQISQAKLTRSDDAHP